MNKPKTEYKLYILMRSDLPSLNTGKAMAQAAHAANDLVGKWGSHKSVDKWQKEAGNYGTTIVLSVDRDTLVRRLKNAENQFFPPPFGFVYDKTYPFNTTTEIAALIPKSKMSAPMILKEENRVVLFRCELTCGYVLVATGNNNQQALVSDLPLY